METPSTETLSLDVPLYIRFEGSTRLGTGRSEGPFDQTIQRDADGQPYVPGSALKGALRMTAERLVGQLNEISDLNSESHLGLQRRGDQVLETRCLAPRPEEMCQSRGPCVVCRLFGNVFTGPRLRVSDGKQASRRKVRQDDSSSASTGGQKTSGQKTSGQKGENAAPERSLPERSPSRQGRTDVLTRLRIDRRRKGAEEGALFTSEYGQPTSPYAATLTGTLPVTPLPSAGDVPAELVLLAATVAATDQIGGEGSTGHGACRLQLGGGSGDLEDASPEGPSPEEEPTLEEESSLEEESLSEEPALPYSMGTLLSEDALRALAWHRFMD